MEKGKSMNTAKMAERKPTAVEEAQRLLDEHNKSRLENCSKEIQEILKLYNAELKVLVTLNENTVVPSIYIHLL